jgi:hypothetical protein
MYIITGLGRSGTSFIAEIFHNLGYDMGKHHADIDAGYEHPNITSFNHMLLGLLKNNVWEKTVRFK